MYQYCHPLPQPIFIFYIPTRSKCMHYMYPIIVDHTISQIQRRICAQWWRQLHWGRVDRSWPPTWPRTHLRGSRGHWSIPLFLHTHTENSSSHGNCNGQLISPSHTHHKKEPCVCVRSLLTLGPEFDGPECHPEAVLVGHQTEDGVCDTTAIETPNTLRVKVLQQSDIQQIQVTRDHRQGKAGEQQVHLYTHTIIIIILIHLHT